MRIHRVYKYLSCQVTSSRYRQQALSLYQSLDRTHCVTIVMAPALFQAAALALRASSIICPTTPTCPQDDKCTYMNNGVSLQISCATDYFGGDLRLSQVYCITIVSGTSLTRTDIDASNMFESLFNNRPVCRSQLRQSELLHEEHPHCCPGEVRHQHIRQPQNILLTMYSATTSSAQQWLLVQLRPQQPQQPQQTQ